MNETRIARIVGYSFALLWIVMLGLQIASGV
jgi:hypothetical protein